MSPSSFIGANFILGMLSHNSERVINLDKLTYASNQNSLRSLANDDRYIFNQDGSFTHITNAFNDDPTIDTNGTIVGREVLINELVDGSGGFPNGADIENYDLSDYEGQHTVTAPSGVETITLTGTGFIAYYVGGNHTYVILSRSENEMVLKTTDGNNEFDWGFTLIADD